MTSAFSSVAVAAPIEVFNVGRMYRECTAENKVDLGVGAYRDDNGKPWVLPVVRKAEQLLAADESQNHEYLPVLGYEPFTTAAMNLVLGANSPTAGRAFGVQCLSGTGSLRIAAEVLNKQLGRTTVYVSEPTWGNHNGVFRNAGFSDIRKYRYWKADTRSLDFDGMIADLSAAPPNSVVILHGCAHNPTGCDPTNVEWEAISNVIKKRGIFVLFDIAYQGFASGNADQDAAAIRAFAADGHEMFIAQSFAKNFGLYNERIGNLVCIVNDASVIEAVKSQISLIVRTIYSNPPNHGAKIVAMILTTPAMRAEWEGCLKIMSGRIIAMRRALVDNLVALGTPGDWSHITSQIGMFSYLGISESQVAHMQSTNNIFLLKSSRISIAGLTPTNVAHVAQAIHDAVTNKASKL